MKHTMFFSIFILFLTLPSQAKINSQIVTDQDTSTSSKAITAFISGCLSMGGEFSTCSAKALDWAEGRRSDSSTSAFELAGWQEAIDHCLKTHSLTDCLMDLVGEVDTAEPSQTKHN